VLSTLQDDCRRLEQELREYKARAHALLKSKENELRAARDMVRCVGHGQVQGEAPADALLGSAFGVPTARLCFLPHASREEVQHAVEEAEARAAAAEQLAKAAAAELAQAQAAAAAGGQALAAKN
jgi:hypothetical protein